MRLPILLLAAAVLVSGCQRVIAPRGADRTTPLVDAVRRAAQPMTGAEADYDRVLAALAGSHVVLLGESTHGTHEFYRERARITERLIRDHGFTALVIEGDWIAAAGADAYVRGVGPATSPAEALHGFQRFPRWMWRNEEFATLLETLRHANAGRTSPVRIYGMDLYAVAESAAAVPPLLEAAQPRLAARARERYGCFGRFRRVTEYGERIVLRGARSCERPAQDVLHDVRRIPPASRTDPVFDALQHARVVKNGEEYLRAQAAGRPSSWNLRDHHMADTIDEVLARRPGLERLVVWAHNSHNGDAAATTMGTRGEWNLAYLLRKRHGPRVATVGFTTYAGTVLAASEWGQRGRRVRLRPALRASFADIFHRTSLPAFTLLFRGPHSAAPLLREPRMQRAVGVVYRADAELESHYLRAYLPRQFDAVVHIDQTTAVTPLD